MTSLQPDVYAQDRHTYDWLRRYFNNDAKDKRSEASYTSSHFTPRDPVIPPIETPHTTHPTFAATQNDPGAFDFNQTPDFYSAQQNPAKNQPPSLDPGPKPHRSEPYGTEFNASSPTNQRDGSLIPENTSENPKPRDIDSTQGKEHVKQKPLTQRNKDRSSPLSNESLSDSEVPPNGVDAELVEEREDVDEKKEHYKQAGYFKKYLKGYSENKDDPHGFQDNPESQIHGHQNTGNNNTDKELEKKEIVDTEEAVKAELDEAIRQHTLRLTQPLRDPENQNEAGPPSGPNTTQPASSSGSQPQHEFTSPQLSPYAAAVSGGGRHSIDRPPPDFQRNDSDPISPRAAHIRQLQFLENSLSPTKQRDFGPLGPAFPGAPLGAAGIPLPNPYHHHQLNHLADLHIQRSRANTVPATDLIPRPRSDSFSSLPEGRRKRDHTDFYYCHLCSYVGTTDFHFQAHMNSHFEHQCPHCDYKSRTEGRLKRHIKDFHSEENPADFTGGRIMRREPGKPKLFRCRQCEFVAEEKEEYWKHARSHIKDDKCLQCPKCPFVTEYKHHLEYHLRNHFGSKPFKCNKCNYSCVNKSMLNSHMKSHTNVYQYRCADCTYATKYCHSLKLHLHKYNHKPAMVLNSDGSLPNDGLGDFDLVSKRGPPRGPRSMKRDSCSPPMDGVPGLLGHMHPGIPGPNPLNGMHAMMGGFWPNGVAAPPPLIPVSGLPPMPGMPPNHAAMTPEGGTPGRHMGMGIPPPGAANRPGGRNMKCQLCDFSCEIPQMLMEHTIRVHGRENSDLLDMFSISQRHRRDMVMQHQKSLEENMAAGMREMAGGTGAPHDSLEAMRMLASRGAVPRHPSFSRQHSTDGGNVAEMAGRGTPSPDHFRMTTPLSPPSPDVNDKSLSPRSPGKHNHNSGQNSSKSSSTGETSQQNQKQNGGERPLDLSSLNPRSPHLGKRRWLENDLEELDQDRAHFEQPHSAESAHSEGANSQDSQHQQNQPESAGSRPTSPVVPRKRSRKGNPYKLDALSMKLQTQRGSGTEDASTSEGLPDDTMLRRSNSVSPHSNSIKNIDQYYNNNKKESLETDAERTENQEINALEKLDFSAIQRNLKSIATPNGTEPLLSRDSKSPPMEKNDAIDDDNQSPTMSSPNLYFSTSIDRRKMLEKFNRSREMSSTPNGKITPHKLYIEDDECTKNSDDLEDNKVANMDDTDNDGKWSKFVCHHCGIAFSDCIMYSIHCGYHGYKDPFKCNSCGIQTHDKVEFFLHIARTAHS